MFTVQGAELEHSVEQILPVPSEFTVCVLDRVCGWQGELAAFNQSCPMTDGQAEIISHDLTTPVVNGKS